MGIFKNIKRWWESLWQKEAQNKFKVKTLESDMMKMKLLEWLNIYQGKPLWVDEDIESFNFAKKLCNETARLATLDLKIAIEGSSRADWINGFMDTYIIRMQNEEFEKACAFGYIILKPNGNSIDYVMPWDFCITATEDGNITGGIFYDRHYDSIHDKYYTRLEWHRFEQQVPESKKLYRITNKAYISDKAAEIGREVDIKKTLWSGLLEDAAVENVEKPLFAVLKMPIANNISIGSPQGMSIYSNAEKELKTLDIAWTRFKDEIFDSQKVTFLGDMLISGAEGKPVNRKYDASGVYDKTGKALPRHVRILPGSNMGDEYHEEVPTMQTEDRISGINHLLNCVGVKCGYSTGQFVLNGRTGNVTATQVESDDRETIQTIKQIRDSFQSATDALVYALDKWADIYNITPPGVYEINYGFGDITYNWEEDRTRHWQYVQNGKYPLWMYYVNFEGMSEEEAKAVVAEAKAENAEQALKQMGLFGM